MINLNRRAVNQALHALMPIKNMKTTENNVTATLEYVHNEGDNFDDDAIMRLVTWKHGDNGSLSILDVKETTPLHSKKCDWYLVDGTPRVGDVPEYIATQHIPLVAKLWADRWQAQTIIADTMLPWDFFWNGREPIHKVFSRQRKNWESSLDTWFRNHRQVVKG